MWVKDSEGNVSDNSATIKAYTISRSQGTGTTLKTQFDRTTENTSNTNNDFTSSLVVLHGTPIWAKATASTGYTNLTLKHGNTNMTASGGTFNASATESIASTASYLTYTVKYLAEIIIVH